MIKYFFQVASEEVEELRAARQRQEVMVESIIIERDSYKTLAQNAQAANAAADQAMAPGATSTPGGKNDAKEVFIYYLKIIQMLSSFLCFQVH